MVRGEGEERGWRGGRGCARRACGQGDEVRSQRGSLGGEWPALA